MTGYGRAHGEDGFLSVDAEIRTVNGRYLNIVTKLPQELTAWEPQIKKIMGEKLSRGTINIAIVCTDKPQTNLPRFNEDVLRAYYESLVKLATSLGAPSPALSDVLSLPYVLEQTSLPTMQEETWLQIQKIFTQALSDMEKMRIQEGEYLQKELEGYCHQIEDKILRFKALAPQVYEAYQTKLETKMVELAQQANFPLERQEILHEVALLAEKADITEELVRLESHLSQFEATLVEAGPIGKKMEFILQEMSREVNTLSTKISHAECSSIAIDLKSLLEKIREQIQNIE